MDMDLYRLFASFTAFLLQKMTNNGEVWYDIKQKSCVFSGVKNVLLLQPGFSLCPGCGPVRTLFFRERRGFCF